MFVGILPMVPDKVSEPLLMLVESSTRAADTYSSWQ